MLLRQFSNWLPQIMLGVFRPAEEVGIYNAAFRVANLTSLVLLGVNSVVFPKFAALFSADHFERLKALAQSSARLMTLACLPFLAVLIAFPSQVLSLFGNDFADGALALQIVAVGQLINVVTGSVGGLLNMTGHQHMALRCGLISFAVMLVALGGLAPGFGLVGTAIAQSLGVIVNMALLSFACRRSLGFAPIGGIKLSKRQRREGQ
jgi:O-antigen/teichoic acid export membrane protein